MTKAGETITFPNINKSFAKYLVDKEKCTLCVTLPISKLNNILLEAGKTHIRVNTAGEVGLNLEENLGEISFGVHPYTISLPDGQIPSGEQVCKFAMEEIGDVLGICIYSMSWCRNNEVAITFFTDGIRAKNI